MRAGWEYTRKLMVCESECVSGVLICEDRTARPTACSKKAPPAMDAVSVPTVDATTSVTAPAPSVTEMA
jgi:hypothetical protein